MNPLARRLQEEIRRNGPISFHRFMEAALYDPESGYYRQPRDPFGKGGDYYTAEQLQPVFGILIARQVRVLFEELGSPRDFVVVELGAGRGEMAEAFSQWNYIPVELSAGALPERFTGVVFANEFFDALPVHVITWRAGAARELRVGCQAGRFVWVEGDRASSEVEAWLRAYLPPLQESQIVEVNLDALRWLDRIAAALESGYVLTIDYGYTRAEAARFPEGTLMSYRRHAALENVLDGPGERDITAHVCFTALEEHGAARGLDKIRFETLAQTLLRAGEVDEFSAALKAGTAAEEIQRRLQLKNLLFGMGETFRTLLQRREQK